MGRKNSIIIDGKRFDIVHFGNKNEMDSKAKEIRKLGYNARVFYSKEGNYYKVYQCRTKRNIKR